MKDHIREKEELKEVEGGETEVRMYLWEKNLFDNKKKNPTSFTALWYTGAPSHMTTFERSNQNPIFHQ